MSKSFVIYNLKSPISVFFFCIDSIFQPIVLLDRFDISTIKKKAAVKKKAASSTAEQEKKLKPDRRWFYCTECTAKFDLKANLRK